MPNHPVIFVLSLVAFIYFARLLARTLITEYKYGRTSTSHFYLSDEHPPLTREQYMEITGIDPLTYPVTPHSAQS